MSELRRIFEEGGGAAPTIGVEEELMLLDPETLDLAPRAGEVLARLEGDPRFKPELPAAQLELLTTPAEDLGELAAQLAAGRRDLAAAAEGIGRLAGSGAHPFAAVEGELNQADAYRLTRDEYGPVARRQLVFGLHVHVRIGGAERSLAVYNALRSYLGEIAALAANAPLHGGRDTGLASIRPKISETLPRQGVPPAFASLDEFEGALGWAAAAGVAPEPRMWWWELRLHPVHGTIEARVPDQQATVAETVAVAAFVRGLVVDLAARYDAGESLPVHPTWRIGENRWSAGRHGLDGTLADLDSGVRRPTRERLTDLIDRVGADAARPLTEENGAIRQRAWAAAGGPEGAARELAERFLA
ncbi:MAG TPA: YbdK family carboxylate-amine ligase [Solirubrobacterales bacterium]